MNWTQFVRATGLAALWAILALGTASAETKTPHQIKIGTINILTFSPIYVAQDLGYFRDEGLEVELFEATSGTNLNAALLAGSIEASGSGFTNPVIMAGKGKAIESLVGLEMGSPYVFMADPALGIPPDDPQAMADALRGKKFGVVSLGSTGHMIAEGVLSEYGLKPEEVNFLAIGTGASALAAMKAGAVDAMNPTEPDVTRILDTGEAEIVLDLRTSKALPKFSQIPSTTVQATSEWITANPEMAQAIIRAISRANRTLRDDPQTSLKVLSALYPAISPEKVAAMYEITRTNFRTPISPEQYQAAHDFYLDAQIIDTPVSYEAAVAEEFKDLWGEE